MAGYIPEVDEVGSGVRQKVLANYHWGRVASPYNTTHREASLEFVYGLKGNGMP